MAESRQDGRPKVAEWAAEGRTQSDSVETTVNGIAGAVVVVVLLMLLVLLMRAVWCIGCMNFQVVWVAK